MRIGLIAMSGIRAYDEELLRLGLTLPGFVERSKTVASLPSLGLLTLAGMTPKEHEITYIEVDDIRTMRTLPNGFDLVGISSYTAQMEEGYELAQRYRALGVKTVLGGPHVSCVPEEAARYADAVVIGEGESSWPAVLHDRAAGNMQTFYGVRDGDLDFNDAPMPAYELLDISKYNRLTVQTSRGCPHHCEFCASSVILAQKYKQKPLGKVLAELDKILTLWDRPFIEFADDNAIVDLNYWRALMPELRKRNIRWFAETDISVSRGDELLSQMRASGCAQVLIGLESPLEADLDGVEMNNNWKMGQWTNYREAIRKIQSHGIAVNGCFVLGMDTQGPDIFNAVLEFAMDTELYDVQITIQTPFPGTPLHERLEREGRLLEKDLWKRCTLFDITYQPKRMSIEELARGFRELGVKLYSDELTNWRRSTFKKRWRDRIHAERALP
ncbi:MAG: cobalamin B12-binding domain-containing protein [Candidatus Hydrogenedentes bacterium]|nr:cobalamin B12-binding domain-containing protein [Candidatus Hydrogenedentota bacterium]